MNYRKSGDLTRISERMLFEGSLGVMGCIFLSLSSLIKGTRQEGWPINFGCSERGRNFIFQAGNLKIAVTTIYLLFHFPELFGYDFELKSKAYFLKRLSLSCLKIQNFSKAFLTIKKGTYTYS